jgi:hypothetical protein
MYLARLIIIAIVMIILLVLRRFIKPDSNLYKVLIGFTILTYIGSAYFMMNASRKNTIAGAGSVDQSTAIHHDVLHAETSNTALDLEPAHKTGHEHVESSFSADHSLHTGSHDTSSHTADPSLHAEKQTQFNTGDDSVLDIVEIFKQAIAETDEALGAAPENDTDWYEMNAPHKHEANKEHHHEHCSHCTHDHENDMPVAIDTQVSHTEHTGSSDNHPVDQHNVPHTISSVLPAHAHDVLPENTPTASSEGILNPQVEAIQVTKEANYAPTDTQLNPTVATDFIKPADVNIHIQYEYANGKRESEISGVNITSHRINECIVEYTVSAATENAPEYIRVSTQCATPEAQKKRDHSAYLYKNGLYDMNENQRYENCTWAGIMYRYSGTYISSKLEKVKYDKGNILTKIKFNNQVKFYVFNVPNKINIIKQYQKDLSDKYGYNFTGLQSVFTPKLIRFASFIISSIMSMFEMLTCQLHNLFAAIILLVILIKAIFMRYLYSSYIKSKQNELVTKTLLLSSDRQMAEKAMVDAMSAAMRIKMFPMFLRLFSFIVINRIIHYSAYVNEMPLLWVPQGSLAKDPQMLFNFIPNLLAKFFGAMPAIDGIISSIPSILNPGLITIMTVIFITLEQRMTPQMPQNPSQKNMQNYFMPLVLLLIFNYALTPITCACVAAHAIAEILFNQMFSIIASVI